MENITEDELSKALGDPVDIVEDQLKQDLLGEEQPSDQVSDQVSEQVTEQPADSADSEKEEPKPEEQDQAQPENQEQEQSSEEETGSSDDTQPESKEPELILGKFKSQDDLINAYKNLEKKMGEKAQEAQEVKQVTSDQFDMAVQQKIAEENWKLVDKAFSTITNPDDAKEAQFLLSQFKKTGDGAFLEQARGYLDKRIDRRLEVDAMNTSARITQEANAHRDEILMKPLAEELDKMVEEDPEFMNDKQNQDLMGMAIKLNPMTVDVRAVKRAIQEYSKTQYQKGYEAAKKEYAKRIETKAVPVKTAPQIVQPAPKKDFSAMSIQDQLKEEYKDLDLL